MVEEMYANIQKARFDESASVREVDPMDQVHRLVQKFNKANSVDDTKVNCKDIVDPFAGGSGILEQVSSLFESSLKPDDFKKYEFISEDHPDMKKSIELNFRVDIFDGQANGANWINHTETGLLQRAWWGKKCLEKRAYRLQASAGEQWTIIVNSARKGEKLFANSTCVERASSPKEVHVYAKCVKAAKAKQDA
ncbi:hypothetical protein CYMTET_13647 [Cymbomonas tetramitiformis]|uniref:Uncharacterized protein n=1 Tax=Cymbomonas tetramitiformis TaxID=36881 RepID=A0AAE0GHP3_9CHLO|nr:hypothetical protein CYMTET_13647 [Cymbomonas tetramitiformis]